MLNWKDILEDFLSDQKFKNNSDKTIEDYKQFLGYFLDYTFSTPDAITFQEVRDYYFYMESKVSDVSISTYMRHLKVFLNFCVKKYGLNSDIADFDIPKFKKKQIQILSKDEIKQILNFYDDDTFSGCRNKLIFSLLIELGLRRSEINRLCLSDIKGYRIRVTGKGDKERILPVGHNVLFLLNKYLDFRVSVDKNKIDFLFLTSYGEPIGYYFLQKQINRLKKQLHINNLYTHLFRHTFATYYLINGGDPIRLKVILGHTSLKMVDYYTHLANQYLLSRDDSLIDSLFD